jgi:hypothetical protein
VPRSDVVADWPAAKILKAIRHAINKVIPRKAERIIVPPPPTGVLFGFCFPRTLAQCETLGADGGLLCNHRMAKFKKNFQNVRTVKRINTAVYVFCSDKF